MGAKKVKVVKVFGQVSEAAYDWDSYEQDKATFGAEPGDGEVLIGQWDDMGYVGLTYQSLDVGEATHPLHVDDEGLWVVADEPGVNRKLVGKRFTDVWITREKIAPPRRRFHIRAQGWMSGHSRWIGRESTPGGSWFAFGSTRDEVLAQLAAHLKAEAAA